MKIPPMATPNFVYQHHTGYYVFVKEIADVQDDPVIVYAELESGRVNTMKAEEFIAPVGDTFTFMPVNSVQSAISVTPTAELLEEIMRRPDNPFDSMKSLEDDDDVYAVDYFLGKLTMRYDSELDKDVETFIPLTPNVFNSYEEAKNHAERFYPHKRWVVVRRVTRAVSE